MGEPPYRAVAIWKFRYFELRDARRLPTEPVTKNDTADLKRGERKGRTVAASAHNAEDNPGTLRANGFGRPTESSQQGRPDGASNEFFGEAESEKRYGTCVRTGVSLVLGVRGCPKPKLPTTPKYFEIMVSAAGFEPATHALKGHCSTN